MPKYKSAHSKKRVLNWFLFSWKLLKLKKLYLKRPDVIYMSSPSLVPFLSAFHLSRVFLAKLVFEVRDIWPLTLLELGGFSKKHPFILFMQWVEDFAYKSSSAVISNLPFAVEHMVSRGMARDKFTWLPNGISLDEINDKQELPLRIFEKIPKGKFVVGYTGSLGIANAVDDLLHAAVCLRYNDEIHFVIVGDGRLKVELIALVQKLSLSNVSFLDAIPKGHMQSMISLFDVCYIGWQDKPIYRFGIAANKLPEYMISGKPIIHSYAGHGDYVQEAIAGITVPPKNPQKLVEAIYELKEMDKKLRDNLGMNGKNYALKHFDYEVMSHKLSSVLFS